MSRKSTPGRHAFAFTQGFSLGTCKALYRHFLIWVWNLALKKVRRSWQPCGDCQVDWRAWGSLVKQRGWWEPHPLRALSAQPHLPKLGLKSTVSLKRSVKIHINILKLNSVAVGRRWTGASSHGFLLSSSSSPPLPRVVRLEDKWFVCL